MSISVKNKAVKISETDILKGKLQSLNKLQKQWNAVETKLNRERQHLSLILQNVSDLIFLIRIESGSRYIYEFVNNSYSETTGRAVSGLLGKSLDKILGSSKFKEIKSYYAKIIKSGKPLQREEIWNDIPGKEIYVEVTLTPLFGENNKCTHILGSARNISERKKREKEVKDIEVSYKNLFDTVTEAIYIQDENGKFLDVNKGAQIMYGYEKKDFLGKTPEFLSAPGKNDMIDTFEKIKKAYNGETQVFKWWGLRKNGEVFPKEIILNKVSYLGKPVIITASRDITERENTEAKLKSYAEELQEINASKDKFFSIIAHDLRSPFNGLLGFSRVLSEEHDQLSKEEIKEFIEYVHFSAKTVYSLVENLLQWSRIHTGKMEYQPVKTDMHEETYKIINLFTSNAIAKKIILINDIPRYTYVLADQNMLHSVLQNLVSNAIKFSRTGGKIEFTSAIRENFFEVGISDNGIGISEENLQKLFRIDKQFSTTGTENEGGSGLGLILVKELVEKNLGTISVNSKIGEGTTFLFTLPLFKNIP